MSVPDYLRFNSDYMEGAHPEILRRLGEENLKKHPGYGEDDICEAAKAKIREACGCPAARVEFLVGGTQTNATVIDALLRNWQGAVSAATGHIALHEAGAIEASRHKVLAVPSGPDGKLTAEALEAYLAAYWADGDYEHMVEPGLAYISQPTEHGAVYSKAELTALHDVCRRYNIPLYVDGARLAYALAAEGADVTLHDLCELTDAFYIGGTKCGALIGEAVVFPNPDIVSHFVAQKKQHGGLLAKGWLLGLQYYVLFSNDLYLELGKNAIHKALRLRDILLSKGYTLYYDSPTNQQYVLLENEKMQALSEKCAFAFWENADENHTVVRFCTSWATTDEQLDALAAVL